MVCYEREDDMRRAVEELDGREINGKGLAATYFEKKVLENFDPCVTFFAPRTHLFHICLPFFARFSTFFRCKKGPPQYIK